MPPHRSSIHDAEHQPVLNGLLEAVVESGNDVTPRLILADWLEEHDRPQEAELLRLHLSILATCCEPEKEPECVQQLDRFVELLAAGVRPCVPRRTIALKPGVDMKFAWIPPGTFVMGSPNSDPERFPNETQHRVTLTRGFYLGIHAVTQSQWKAVMGNNPSRFKGKQRPVEQVSWEDCQAFCTRLSQVTGKRFGLPTEAEWEYACRAGTTTPFHFGYTITPDDANYDDSLSYRDGVPGVCRKGTACVGSFPPNAWGLFEMHGNVWEWCQDSYGPYSNGNLIDPLNVDNSNARVARGGSWGLRTDSCRSATRANVKPSSHLINIGFRIAFHLD
jgi:sulfatase modifying factor 1